MNTTTPKARAKQLVNRFYYCNVLSSSFYSDSFQVAEICCKEIIKATAGTDRQLYFKEVLKEIVKLKKNDD